jgi:hypothetical protein
VNAGVRVGIHRPDKSRKIKGLRASFYLIEPFGFYLRNTRVMPCIHGLKGWAMRRHDCPVWLRRGRSGKSEASAEKSLYVGVSRLVNIKKGLNKEWSGYILKVGFFNLGAFLSLYAFVKIRFVKRDTGHWRFQKGAIAPCFDPLHHAASNPSRP